MKTISEFRPSRALIRQHFQLLWWNWKAIYVCVCVSAETSYLPFMARSRLRNGGNFSCYYVTVLVSRGDDGWRTDDSKLRIWNKRDGNSQLVISVHIGPTDFSSTRSSDWTAPEASKFPYLSINKSRRQVVIGPSPESNWTEPNWGETMAVDNDDNLNERGTKLSSFQRHGPLVY